MRLLLPGLFLFLLGVGNISVGIFKGNQYDEVLQELAGLEPTPGLETASPLRRVQMAKETADRLYERQDKAEARKEFYELVAFGGKVFVTLSMPFVCGGLLVFLIQLRRSEDSPQPQPQSS